MSQIELGPSMFHGTYWKMEAYPKQCKRCERKPNFIQNRYAAEMLKCGLEKWWLKMASKLAGYIQNKEYACMPIVENLEESFVN